MGNELFIFRVLEERDEEEMVGSTIEVSEKGLIRRGKIEYIMYWHSHIPQQIIWIEGWIWKAWRKRWKLDHTRQSYISFAHTDVEFFTGPFEMGDKRIVFMAKGLYCVTIYPKYYCVPDLPLDESEYREVRQTLIGTPVRI